MTDNQQKILDKLRALGRPAGTAELHNGSTSHISTTRNAILALEADKIVARVGTGKATKYRLRATTPSVRAVASARRANADAERRWVILVDGEALIVNAKCVSVFPERQP